MESASTPPPRSTDRLMQALSTLAALLDRTINEVKVLDGDFQKRLLQAVHDTEAQASQEMNAAVETVRKELEAEREKLDKELDRATKTAAQWEAERAQLQAEYARAKQALAEARSAQEKAEKAQAAADAASQSQGTVTSVDVVLKEIERVESLIKSISALIDDPATDLSTVIRKNVERAELESYLKGMRFAVDGK